jgi:hypothetical protein
MTRHDHSARLEWRAPSHGRHALDLVRRSILFAVIVGLGLLTPAGAWASTADIGVSADPTEEKPVTVTVTGVADTSARLYLYELSGTSACPTTASSLYYGYELSGTDPFTADGDAIAASAYSRSYQFTPAAAGAYRVCAYLATSSSAVPQAFQGVTIVARMPEASLGIAQSADPTEEQAITYTVTGDTEVDRRVFVFALSGSTTCPSSPSGLYYGYELSGTDGFSSDGDVVAAGPFTKSYGYTPSNSGAYRVCAYVAETGSSTPNASSTKLTIAREPHAQVAIAVSAEPAEEQPVTLTASGTSEADRRLYVYALAGTSACPSSPSGLYYGFELSGTDGFSSDGDVIAAGAFSRSYQYSPVAAGAYRLCAYVDEAASDTPNASVDGSFVARNPTVALTATITPDTYAAGDTLTATVTARAERDRRLYVLLAPATKACPTAPNGLYYGYERTGSDAFGLDGDPITAGAEVTRAYAIVAMEDVKSYAVCAYVGESAGDIEGAGSAVATLRETPAPAQVPTEADQIDAAYLVTLVTEDDEDQHDRITLQWRKGPRDSDDHIYVYDHQPGVGSPAIWDGAADSPDVDLSDPGDIRRAHLRRFLGYGRLWWRIGRSDTHGHRTFSEARRVHVIPRPLKTAAATVKATLTTRPSSAHPGHVRLVVRSSPLAEVSIVVRHAGRRVARHSYTEGVGGVRGFNFALSCARTGRFAYTVAIKDPYGTNVQRQGSWTSSSVRCARLKAVERARAEAKRRAAARRRQAAERKRRREQRQEQQSSSDAPSDSGSGDVGTCSDTSATNFPVSPGDPRDGDGDGIACET